jgi:hypothetical protein
VWFITYRHAIRPNEAGIKFVHNEAATVTEVRHLEAVGYVITKIAPTSKTRMDAFLAGTLADPERLP